MILVEILNGIFFLLTYFPIGYYLNTGKLLFILTLQQFILINSLTISNSFQLILLGFSCVQS